MPTTINVAPLEETDTGYVEDETESVWADYKITNRYERDKHVFMMPVTLPAGFKKDTAAFVQLAAPTLLWVCEWTCCRSGTKPVVPDPEPSNPQWVLLDAQLSPFMVGLAADGTTPLFRLSGKYIYGCRNPKKVLINFPRPPWLTNSFDRYLKSDMFADNLSEVTGSQGGGKLDLGLFI